MPVLQRNYFELMKSGEKTIEGRLAQEKYTSLRCGTPIEFTSADNPKDKIKRTVVKVEKYKNFREMLSTLGWKRLLGEEVRTLDEAVNIYHIFGDYAKLEHHFGVCAIYLSL